MRPDRPAIDYINLGPWPGYVGFTTSPEAFAKEMKRLAVDVDVPFLGHANANGTTHMFEYKGSLCQIITLQAPHLRISPECYAALIAHECAHVVQHMREEFSRGENLGAEAEAYLIQHLVQECLQIAKYRQRVKRIAPPTVRK